MPGTSRRPAERLRAAWAGLLLWATLVAAAEEPPPVTIVQDGRSVPYADGGYTLRPAPFLVLSTPTEGPISLVPEREGKPPEIPPGTAKLVAAPAAMAVATTPLSLQTQAVPPEVFDGLSAPLLEQWGSVLGPERVAAYRDLEESRFGKLPVLMAGRQHPAGRAGARALWPVFALDGQSLGSARVSSLVLHVFRTVMVTGSDAAWTVLRWMPVTLRFRGTADVAARPSEAASARLDCGNSAVVSAVRSGQWQRVERLLRDGLDPNLRVTKRGLTLLMCALTGPAVSPETVAALLSGGADPNLLADDGQTAMHWAVRAIAVGGFAKEALEAFDLLARRGGDVEAESAAGETPLLVAVALGSTEAVAALMLAGADPGIQNRRGESALARARSARRADLGDWMIRLRSDAAD